MRNKISNIKGLSLVGLFMGLMLPLLIVVAGAGSANAATRVVQNLSTGQSTACAVVDFDLQCWGDNTYGQVGVGTTGGKKTSPVRVDVAGSLLAGKDIEKVAVGTNHACALAEAQVFCWGNNSAGQLGNRSNTNSNKPVAIDTKKAWLEVIPAHCQGTSGPWGCAFPFGSWVAEQRINHEASSLYLKEVVDITAGDNMTCALASDGAVSCWGDGADGRLGNGGTGDTNIPKLVTGAVAGKKMTKLARAKADAVCATSNEAKTYCWGLGVGPGTAPATSKKPCGAGSTTSIFYDTTQTVYFNALQAREVPNVPSPQRAIDITSDNYITAVGNDNRAYYWGLHGYTARSKVDTSKYCVVKSGSGGLDSSGGMCGGGGNHGKPGCGSSYIVHYGEITTYTEIGHDSPQGPLYNGATPANAFNQKTLSLTSGNGYSGLFCGVISSGLYCDPHGTKTTSGQAGNNSTASVTGAQKVYADAGWLNGKTPVFMDTGTAGSTGIAGNANYTCAATTSSIACWGVNGSGQLGNGSTTSKSVPTEVILAN